jgi:phage baseplate assembly protein W
MPSLSREIRVPFHIGPQGGIDYTTDRVEQAMQHILAAAATLLGERVMRPTYGTPLAGLLFEADDPLVQTQVAAQISVAIKTWVPDVTVEDIRLESSRPDDAQAVFRITFSLAGSNDVHVAVVNVGGTVNEFTVIP